MQKRVSDEERRFGDELRELRELRGYTLEDLGRITGIHPSIIRAFEDERLEDMKDAAYAERHVRALVLALEGRLPFFLAKYQIAIQRHGIAKDHGILLKPRVKRSDFFVGSRMTIALVVVAVLAGIATFTIWEAMNLSAKPHLVVLAPDDGVRLVESRVRIVGKTDSGALVRINEQPAIVDPTGAFSETLSLPGGVSDIRIEARRRYGSSVTIVRHVLYDRPVAPHVEDLVVPTSTVNIPTPTSTLAPTNTRSTVRSTSTRRRVRPPVQKPTP